MAEPTELVATSLALESADMVTLAQYVIDEIASIVADEQANAAILRDLERIDRVMDDVVAYFGG
jgi:hypothetical protein